MDRAGPALTERVAADKREAVGKEIQADVKKYLDEAVPLVTSRAVKLAPSTVGPFLEEKFTEDELKQISAFLESPAVNKFQQLSGEMQKVLLEKVVADTKGVIEPKVVALEQSVGNGTIAPVVRDDRSVVQHRHPPIRRPDWRSWPRWSFYFTGLTLIFPGRSLRTRSNRLRLNAGRAPRHQPTAARHPRGTCV